MRKILYILIIILIAINYFIANATDWDDAPIKVVVTEYVPGAGCSSEIKDGELTGRYECEVPKWANAVTWLLWDMLEYVIFIVMLWWVLFLVVNWVVYSMWWLDQSLKDGWKDRIKKSLLWLLLLLLAPVVLVLIAPWVYEK